MNHLLRPMRNIIRRGVGVRYSSSHDYEFPFANHPDFRYVSMDEAPQPQGSWKDHFEKKQKLYNMQLFIGVGSLLATIIAINQFELIYFNYAPPDVPDVD